MSTIREISDGMASAVQTAAPSIIRVEGRRWSHASGLAWLESGVIVTANHVVERDDEIKLGLPGAEGTVAATLVGRDEATDLAVLKVQGGSLVAVTLVEPESVKVGELVLALGRPGRSVQSSLGVVHAAGGEWRSPAGGRVESYLQPDLVMYPGFSGGPLVNVAGQVGLLRNTAVTLTAPVLRRVVTELLAHGHMRRGYLGIGSQPVRLPEAVGQQVAGDGQAPEETGLLISSVEAGSPADKAGLMLGDTLVAVDDRTLLQMDDLFAFLNGDVAGHSVMVTVLRGGSIQKLALVVGEK